MLPPVSWPTCAFGDLQKRKIEHRVRERTEFSRAVADNITAAKIAVDIFIRRRRLFDRNRVPVGFHFLRQHLRKAGTHALSHFRVRNNDGDLVVGRQFHPCVENNLIAIGDCRPDRFSTGSARARDRARHRRRQRPRRPERCGVAMVVSFEPLDCSFGS